MFSRYKGVIYPYLFKLLKSLLYLGVVLLQHDIPESFVNHIHSAILKPFKKQVRDG